jgi:hypothetical protein
MRRHSAYAEASNGEDSALWGLNALAHRQRFGSRLPFGLRDPFGIISRGTMTVDGEVIRDYPGFDYDWIEDENATIRDLRRDRNPDPYPIAPDSLNGRQAAQRAFFTFDGRLEGGIPYEDLELILRIYLPQAWRTDVMTALRTMGITAASLFPGLDGLGRFARAAASLPDELEDQLGL